MRDQPTMRYHLLEVVFDLVKYTETSYDSPSHCKDHFWVAFRVQVLLKNPWNILQHFTLNFYPQVHDYGIIPKHITAMISRQHDWVLPALDSIHPKAGIISQMHLWYTKNSFHSNNIPNTIRSSTTAFKWQTLTCAHVMILIPSVMWLLPYFREWMKTENHISIVRNLCLYSALLLCWKACKKHW